MPEVDCQRHGKIRCGERIDVVGAAARAGEKDIADADTKACRGFEGIVFAEVETVAEVEVVKIVLLFDELILYKENVVSHAVEVYAECESAVLHAETNADLRRHAVGTAVVERRVIGLYVVGKSIASIEEAYTEVEFNPGIILLFSGLVFLSRGRSDQHRAQGEGGEEFDDVMFHCLICFSCCTFRVIYYIKRKKGAKYYKLLKKTLLMIHLFKLQPILQCFTFLQKYLSAHHGVFILAIEFLQGGVDGG